MFNQSRATGSDLSSPSEGSAAFLPRDRAQSSATPGRSYQRSLQAAATRSLVILCVFGAAQLFVLILAAFTVFCYESSSAFPCSVRWLVWLCAVCGVLTATAGAALSAAPDPASPGGVLSTPFTPRAPCHSGPQFFFVVLLAVLTLVYSIARDTWLGQASGVGLIMLLVAASLKLLALLSSARVNALARLHSHFPAEASPPVSLAGFMKAAAAELRELVAGSAAGGASVTLLDGYSSAPRGGSTQGSPAGGRGDRSATPTSGPGRAPAVPLSGSPAWATYPATGLQIQVPGEENDAERGVFEQDESSKYFCPICMLFYSDLFRTTCCSNYFCDACSLTYIKGKSGQGFDVLHPDPQHNMTVGCPFCNRKELRLARVLPGEEARCYDDSPSAMSHSMKFKHDSASKGSCSPSPLKIGESFDSMKAKMVGFEQVGWVSVDSAKGLGLGAVSASSIPEYVEVPHDGRLPRTPTSVIPSASDPNLLAHNMDPSLLPNTPYSTSSHFEAQLNAVATPLSASQSQGTSAGSSPDRSLRPSLQSSLVTGIPAAGGPGPSSHPHLDQTPPASPPTWSPLGPGAAPGRNLAVSPVAHPSTISPASPRGASEPHPGDMPGVPTPNAGASESASRNDPLPQGSPRHAGAGPGSAPGNISSTSSAPPTPAGGCLSGPASLERAATTARSAAAPGDPVPEGSTSAPSTPISSRLTGNLASGPPPSPYLVEAHLVGSPDRPTAGPSSLSRMSASSGPILESSMDGWRHATQDLSASEESSGHVERTLFQADDGDVGPYADLGDSARGSAGGAAVGPTPAPPRVLHRAADSERTSQEHWAPPTSTARDAQAGGDVSDTGGGDNNGDEVP